MAKRGDIVTVIFTGKVINQTSDLGLRISVDGYKPAWWAVVPEETATVKEVYVYYGNAGT